MMKLSRRKLLWIFGVAVLAASLAAGTLMWEWRELLPPDPSRSLYPVRGIDVSNHNGYIDFNRVAADSIRFVYVKASEGATFRDASFHRNFHSARNAGLKVGAYHFFRFDRSGESQAINLLHALRGKTIDLPVAIDVEQWTNPNDELDRQVVARLEEMTEYLENRGIPVMIYSNRKGFDRFVADRFSDYPLWICMFRTPEKDLDWKFWQFSHRGSVEGVGGSVDINVFNGSSAEFNDATKRWLTPVR